MNEFIVFIEQFYADMKHFYEHAQFRAKLTFNIAVVRMTDIEMYDLNFRPVLAL